MEYINKANAEFIANTAFEGLIEMEEPKNVVKNQNSILKLRVSINFTKPLPKGFWLIMVEKKVWFENQYHKLPLYCYLCSLFEHHDNNGRKERLDSISAGAISSLKTHKLNLALEDGTSSHIRQRVEFKIGRNLAKKNVSHQSCNGSDRPRAHHNFGNGAPNGH